MSGVDKDAFIRCHEAVHLVCKQAIPCVQDVIQDWHSQTKQTLGSCLSPQQCLSKGKPKHAPVGKPKAAQPQGKPTSCPNCVTWGNAIESAEYTNPTQGIETSIAWNNINPTLLFHDSTEVAKAFVLRLPKGQPPPQTLDGFDTASLLMIMMKFEEFHQGNHTAYLAIKKVSDIRNSLSHMKMMDNLHLSKQTLANNFKDIHSLVDCLQRLHPNHFLPTHVKDIKIKLDDVVTSPITAKMRDEALQPLTDAMKDVVCQTLEEQFQKHTPKISDTVTDRVKAANQEHAQEIGQAVQHGFQKHTTKISDTVSECVKAAYQEHTEELSQAVQHGFQKQSQAMSHISEDLQQSSNDHQTQTAALHDTVTRGHRELADAIRQHLETTKQEIAEETSPFDVEACRRDLALYYLREKKTMPLLPDMPEKCLDIMEGLVESTLVRQDTKKILDCYENLVDLKDKYGVKYNRVMVYGQAGAGKTTMISKLAYIWAVKNTEDQNKPIVETRSQPTNRQKQQCQGRFKNKNGIATKLSKWKASENPLESALSDYTARYCSCSSDTDQQYKALIDNFKFVFVINMRQLTKSTNLLDAIQDQLLSKINKNSLESYIINNANSILILLDGYDELPHEYGKHKNDIVQLMCNQWLQDACVIVTTRTSKILEFRDRYKAHVHVDLQGLTQNGIIIYVENFFDIPVHHLYLMTYPIGFIPPCNKHSHYYLPTTLIKTILNLKHLQDLARLPSMLAMFCFLQKEDKQLPESLTILYKELLLCQAKHRWFNVEESDIEDQIQKIMCTLGKVALTDLFQDQLLVFQANVFDSDVLEEAFQMGIMVHIRTTVGLRKRNEALFIHKTFQEFCAATYLAKLVNISTDYFWSWLKRIDKQNMNSMEYLLQFCCGQEVKAGTHILEHIVSIYKDIGMTKFSNGQNETGYLPLLLLQEALPIQNEKSKDLCILVADIFSHCCTLHIDFGYRYTAFSTFITHLIAFSLEYMLSSIQSVQLRYIGNDSMYIIKRIVKAMPHIKELQIKIFPHLDMCGAQKLGTYVGKLSLLTHLEIECFKENALSEFMTSLVKTNDFSKNIINFKYVPWYEIDLPDQRLAQYLSYQLNLNSLYLQCSGCPVRITDEQTAALLLSVKSAPLQNLNLTCCTIGNESIQILGPMAATLHQLVLFENDMQPNHCEQLFHYLAKASKLNKLDIAMNVVWYANSVLVDAFESMNQLRCLRLSKTSLGEIHSLVQGFTYLPNLEELHVDWSYISGSSLIDIANNLHKVSLLKTLNLCWCTSLVDCMEATEILFNNLEHVPQLCKLDLSWIGTCISPRGIKVLFRTLCHHSHLQNVLLESSRVKFPIGYVCSQLLVECFQQLASKHSENHNDYRCRVNYWVLHECDEYKAANIVAMCNLDSKDIEHIKEIVKKYDNNH